MLSLLQLGDGVNGFVIFVPISILLEYFGVSNSGKLLIFLYMVSVSAEISSVDFTDPGHLP